MARTRQTAATSNKGSTSDNSTVEELKQAPTKKRGASDSKGQQQRPAKKSKNSSAPSSDEPELSGTQEVEQQQPLPRLTTPDLEFDWDRSKLKDPRPTPGRERRPRYEDHDIPAELAARRPPSPEKPKGRLNAMQKDALHREKARRDPAETFHDLHVCFDRGPNGPLTHDSAGFRLDYDKVVDWFKPVRYNKNRMIKGMDRALARGQSLNEHTIKAFFEDFEAAKEKLLGSPIHMDIVKDTISKDLRIPRHKIGHEEIDMWEEKGFKKHKAEDWVSYSEEDKKRAMKMMAGASLRA